MDFTFFYLYFINWWSNCLWTFSIYYRLFFHWAPQHILFIVFLSIILFTTHLTSYSMFYLSMCAGQANCGDGINKVVWTKYIIDKLPSPVLRQRFLMCLTWFLPDITLRCILNEMLRIARLNDDKTFSTRMIWVIHSTLFHLSVTHLNVTVVQSTYY